MGLKRILSRFPSDSDQEAELSTMSHAKQEKTSGMFPELSEFRNELLLIF